MSGCCLIISSNNDNLIGNNTPQKILNTGYSKNSLTKLELYGNVNIKAYKERFKYNYV